MRNILIHKIENLVFRNNSHGLGSWISGWSSGQQVCGPNLGYPHGSCAPQCVANPVFLQWHGRWTQENPQMLTDQLTWYMQQQTRDSVSNKVQSEDQRLKLSSDFYKPTSLVTHVTTYIHYLPHTTHTQNKIKHHTHTHKQTKYRDNIEPLHSRRDERIKWIILDLVLKGKGCVKGPDWVNCKIIIFHHIKIFYQIHWSWYLHLDCRG